MSVTNETALPAEACFVNIGPKERQKRLMGGLISGTIGVAVFVIVQALTLPWWANLATLPFFFFAGTGFFQWRDKT
jgi:hypothetical protein